MSSTNALERTVTRNFFRLGSGELLARVIAFLTVVYIARSLGAEAYGLVGFAAAVVLYFSGIADFGIESLGPREVAEDPARARRLAPSLLTARLLIAAALVVVLAGAGLFVLPQPDGTVLALYSLTLLPVGAGTRWIYLGLERAGRVAVARTAGEVLRALLVLLLVHTAGDVLNVPLAQLAGDLFAALLLIWWLRRQGIFFWPQLDWSIVRPVFRRSWPLVLTTLLGLAIYSSDLIFIRFFRTAEEVGYYLAAFTLITLLGNLGHMYSLSLLPTLTRAAKTEENQQALYHTATAHVFAVSLPLTVGGFLLAPQIITFFFGAAYEASGLVLQILFLSVPFLLVRGVLRAVLITTGQQSRIMWITAWTAAANIALNLLIIPRYGMLGAAFTTTVTEVLRMALKQLYARAEGFPLTGFGRLWHATVATLVMTAVLLAVDPPSMWAAIGLGGAVYVGVLALSGGIRFERGRLPVLNV